MFRKLTSRRRVRALLATALVVAAAATAAAVQAARARGGTLGTGIVVVDTTLGLQGGAAAGTGMVLTSSGEILTNNHVIAGATAIKVVVPGTGRSYTARVVGYDVADDVAVLQLEGASNLKTVSVGSSSSPKLGATVTAIGNAGGTGRLSTATGTVTGLAKTITAGDGQGSSEQLTGLIETNAPVIAGDSGGPLENAAGKVIGMTTAASASNEFDVRETAASDAYAIPIAKALSIVKTISSGTRTAKVHIGATAFLGIGVADVTTYPGYGDSTGAVVTGVVDGSAAARVGLEAGDVVTALDGRSVATSKALRSRLLAKHPGDKVSITFADRYGTSHTTTVTLASGPPQ